MPNCARIEIVGLGLAGACLLRALALEGFEGEVVAYEQADGPAQGASGNPLGILHPLRSADHNRSSQFYELGLQTCMAWCESLQGNPQGWAGLNGVVELGTELPGGWIQPARFVQACLQEADAFFGTRLRLRFSTPAPGASRGTRVYCSARTDGQMEAGLSLTPVAGQVSWVMAEPEEGPAKVLCGAGYVAPVVQGRLLVGASFERATPIAEVTLQGHLENLDRLAQLDAPLAESMRERWSRAEGRASVRWATRDRLPLIGQPVDLAALALHPHPQRISQLHHLPRLAETYVLLGLGSRGLTTAPLGAVALARQILGAPAVLPGHLADAVDPGRFVLRAHRRKGVLPEAH